MKHLNFSGSQQGALRRVLSACVLVVSAIYAGAETYVLDWESFNNAQISMTAKDMSYSNVVSHNGASWQFDLGFNESFQLNKPYKPNDGQYLLFVSNGSYVMNSVSLRSDFFKDKLIKSVSVDARCYTSKATETDFQTITVTDNSQPIASQSILVNNVGYLKNEQDAIMFTLDKVVQGSFGISFTSTIGFDFAFKSITIEYSLEIPPVVSRDETIPVGHPLWLIADKEDAAIYYTVDGTENWQTYNPARGVVFETSGAYTLKYYASAGEVHSNVVSEEITVEKLTGLAAARAANEEIAVSGVVCGRGDGYVLIGEDAECHLADCVAIESKDYSQLNEVTDGTTIKATGRPTNRFGDNIKGLGSISALEINGQPLEPAAISPAINAPAPATHYYDLTGRRVDRPTGSHIRRILISPDGEKHLNR